MDKAHQTNYFLILALSASIVLVYFIAQPFLGPLILAAVFAFLFQPIYKKTLHYFKKRESLSAFATTVLAVIFIILPVAFLGTQIFNESTQLYQTLTSEERDFEASIIERIDSVRSSFPILAGLDVDLGQYARRGLEALIQNFGSLFSSFARILLSVIVFLFAFYFFLKDGRKLKDFFIDLSPLEDDDDEFIVSRLKSAVLATVKGNLTIGLTQGTLTGIGFAIFGVPNPALWGGVAVVSAFIPGIGTALVITPAIIFLFLTGNIFGGVGLLIWGVVAVGLVDNFLAPRLIGHGMHLHPLAVFIAVLGGLALFGPLGFLLGPLAVSVCLALIDIYTSLKRNSTKTT